MQYYFSVDVTDTEDIPRFSATLLGSLIKEFADQGHATLIAANRSEGNVHIVASVWLPDSIDDDVLFKVAPAFFSCAHEDGRSVLLALRHDGSAAAQNDDIIVLNPHRYGRVETFHLTPHQRPVISYFTPTGTMISFGEGTTPILTFEEGQYIRTVFSLCSNPADNVKVHFVSGYPNHHDATLDEDLTDLARDVLALNGLDWPFIIYTPYLAGFLIGSHVASLQAQDGADLAHGLSRSGNTFGRHNPPHDKGSQNF